MSVFLLGICLFLLLKNNGLILCLVFLLILIFFILKKNKFYVIILILGLLFGTICSCNNPKYYIEEEYTGIVYERKENYFLFKSGLSNFYVYQKNHNYEMFDIIKIKGNVIDISFSCLEGEFNFENYLYNKKVEKEIKNPKIEYKFYNPIRKQKIINLILEKYDSNSKVILSKLLFFDNNDFSSSLYELNIASYFTLSGIQLLFLYQLLNKIFLYFTNKKKLSKNISIIIISIFVFLNNYRLSLLKNYLLILNKDNKKIKNINIILLIIILFFNYRFIYSSEFIYIFGISFLANIINSFVNKYDIKERKIARISFFSILFNSINVYFNQSINLISILIIPFISYVSKFYLIIFIISLFFPIINVFNFISYLIINIVNFLNKNSFILYFNEVSIVLIVSFFILFIMCYFSNIRLFKINNVLLISYYSLLGICSLPIYSYYSQYVVFINVGQGDCALIHNKNINILIDVGGSIYKDIGNEILIPYFKKNHISYINTIFISHYDYDHYGSLETIKNNLKINEIIIGSSFYEKQVGNINFKNLNIFDMGYEDNNNSSVLYFSFIDKNFLFMGDAGIEIEKNIMNYYSLLDVDIIKIGHHGSSSSSSYEFLKWVNPSQAIISVGKNNYYNLPSNEVINNLNLLKIEIYRTDYNGSIKYTH